MYNHSDTISINFTHLNIIFGCSAERLVYWYDCKIELNLGEVQAFRNYIIKDLGNEAIYPLLSNMTIPKHLLNQNKYKEL